MPSAVLLDGAVYFDIGPRGSAPCVASASYSELGLPAVLFGAIAGKMFGVCALALLLRRSDDAAHARGARSRSRRRSEGRSGSVRRSSCPTTGLLLRLVMLGLPSSALWALVSLVVHERLRLGGIRLRRHDGADRRRIGRRPR